MEEVQLFIDDAKESMEKAYKHTGTDLSKIRAGKANPSMLDGLTVDYYGTPTPLTQVASINTPDARSIIIKPWEKKLIAEIEKAIKNSDLNVNPSNDGEIVRINIPQLTEDRRKDLFKQAKNEAEAGRVRVRNIRKEINEELRKLLKEGVSEDEVKRAEEKVQVLTDSYVKKVDDLLVAKEKEIMTV